MNTSKEVPALSSEFPIFSEWETAAHVLIFSPIWAAQVAASLLLIYVISYRYKRQFHTSGYILVSALLIGEIVFTTTYLICFILSWLKQSNSSMKISSGIAGFLGMALEGVYYVNLGVMTIISVQRVCCIVIPHRFSTIFSIRSTHYSIAVTIFTVIIAEMTSVARGYYFKWDVNMMYIDDTDMNAEARQQFLIFMYLYLYACGLVNLTNYTIIFCKVKFRMKKKIKARIVKVTPGSSQSNRGTEEKTTEKRRGIAQQPAVTSTSTDVPHRSATTRITQDNSKVIQNGVIETISSSLNPASNIKTTVVINENQQIMNRELMLTSQFTLITVLYLVGIGIVTLIAVYPEIAGSFKNIIIIINIVFIGNNCIDPFLYLIMNKLLRDRGKECVKNMVKCI